MKNRILLIALVVVAVMGTGRAQEKAVKAANRYLSQQKMSEAASTIDAAVQDPSTINSLTAWMTRGKIYTAIAGNPLLARDYPQAADRAKESYEKALQIDPSDKTLVLIRQDVIRLSGIFYDQGALQYENHAFADAVASFEKSMQVSMLEGDYDTTAAFNVALCASNAGDLDKAIEYYGIMVNNDYPLSNAYTGMADAYFRKDMREEASKVMEKALELFPDDKNVYVGASSVYLRMGANEKASEMLSRALDKWGDDASFQLFIGIAYENDKRYEEAEAAYKRALEINPEYYEAIFNLGAFYVNKGIRTREEANALPLEASDEYDRLVDKSKNDFNQALPYLQKIIEVQPENMNVLVTMRDVYMQLGKIEEANEIRTKIEALENAAQ
ncbi:MAG: tetratricopeptide repeat protein [Bacteroidales bacterium]|nr:tetratricopeptide repeat protein [Bacteroidales bacterium]